LIPFPARFFHPQGGTKWNRRGAHVSRSQEGAVRDLPFERDFRTWCDRKGVDWRSIRYARPEAGGEAWGHRFSPPIEPVGSVLLVHGGGNDALFALTGLIGDLAARGLEVFSFDVDGHGRGSSTVLSAAPARECVAAALEAWRERPAGVPLHAIGISLGGSILLHSLPGLGGAITSATLMCAPLRIQLSGDAIRRELGLPLLATVWRERHRYGLTGLIPSFGPFRRGAYPLRMADAPGPGPFGYVEVLNRILDGLELERAARDTRVPVLLVYGGRDLLVPADQGRRLHELMAASELLVLERETHLSTPLAPPATERLFAWIDRHPSPSPAVP
jgi:alpha-beta hydrolase superfamily lysophospholipase